MDPTPPKLKWDGSHLGEYKTSIIKSNFVISLTDVNSGTKKPVLFTVIALELFPLQRVIPAIIMKYTNDVPLIIDELKPLFGLKKTGTHTLKLINDTPFVNTNLSSGKYILCNIPSDSTEPIDNRIIIKFPAVLSGYDDFFSKSENYIHIDYFKHEMQLVIIFLHICGIAYQTQKIHIVKSEFNRVPQIFYTKIVSENRSITALSLANLRRWFKVEELDDKTIGNLIIEMLGCRQMKHHAKDSRDPNVDKNNEDIDNINRERIEKALASFRDNFVDIFNRFPDNNILKYWYIVDYVSSKLYDYM